jgi:purine-cytosine permease-like protein
MLPRKQPQLSLRKPGWSGRHAAVAVQVPFIDQTFYTGPLVKALGGIDISWVVGGVAGFVFYPIALRVPARGQTVPAGQGPLGPTALDAPA